MCTWTSYVNVGLKGLYTILIRFLCWVKCSGLPIDFFSYLQANKSACYFFTDTERRQETMWAREKDLFYSQHNIKSMHIRRLASTPLAPKVHGDDEKGLNRCQMCSGKTTSLGEPTAFLAGGKLSLPCPRGKCYFVPQDCLLPTQPWQMS